MLIGWVYPHQVKCGISIYSREYLATSTLRTSTVSIDPKEFLGAAASAKDKIDRCDIIHVQYEAGAYFVQQKDLFGKLLLCNKKPLVVSLHEVYEQDPFAFPREMIGGAAPLRWIRKVLYDKRHPVQACQARHVACQFGADIVTVPYRFQADILLRKKMRVDKIRLLELPLPKRRVVLHRPFKMLPEVNLAAIGFINPAFDYKLLFKVLDGLQRPWKFTWIGGLRNDNDAPLLLWMREEIDKRNWVGRFVITGWLLDEEMDSHIASVDIIFALFIFRSSSASLTRAIGAGRPVIATKLPLTIEIAEGNGAGNPSPLLITDCNPEAVIQKTEELCSDVSMQQRLLEGIAQFSVSRDYESSAKKLMAIYQDVVTI